MIDVKAAGELEAWAGGQCQRLAQPSPCRQAPNESALRILDAQRSAAGSQAGS
jgi:hypothetical protein